MRESSARRTALVRFVGLLCQSSFLLVCSLPLHSKERDWSMSLNPCFPARPLGSELSLLCAGSLSRIYDNGSLQVLRQEHHPGIRTVIQFVPKVGRRECLRDGGLRLGLPDGTNPEPLRLTLGPNPDCVPLAFGPRAGDLSILGGDGQFEFFLFFFLFLRLFLLNRTQDNFGEIDIRQGDILKFQVTAFEILNHDSPDFARN